LADSSNGFDFYHLADGTIDEDDVLLGDTDLRGSGDEEFERFGGIFLIVRLKLQLTTAHQLIELLDLMARHCPGHASSILPCFLTENVSHEYAFGRRLSAQKVDTANDAKELIPYRPHVGINHSIP
jgi:hypothetical protein